MTRSKIFGTIVAQKLREGYRESSAGFEGSLSPDGRFMLPLDGHHRMAAESIRNNGKFLARISRAPDGKYYTTPHFEILEFYHPYFGFSYFKDLSEKERQEALELARQNPAELARRYYYGRVSPRRPDALPHRRGFFPWFTLAVVFLLPIVLRLRKRHVSISS